MSCRYDGDVVEDYQKSLANYYITETASVSAVKYTRVCVCVCVCVYVCVRERGEGGREREWVCVMITLPSCRLQRRLTQLPV